MKNPFKVFCEMKTHLKYEKIFLNYKNYPKSMRREIKTDWRNLKF